MPETSPARKLTLLDCVGLGINGIVGSGIFLLPGRVYLAAGGAGWAAWLAIGALCLLVGLCFGELASMTDRNGGPYVYAREAFGEWAGFAVGWMALASTVLGYSAVARGLGRNLSYLLPEFSTSAMQAALALAIIAALAVLNWFGIKPGAWASNLFSGAKLIPLLIFVALGLMHVDWSRIAAPPPGGRPLLEAVQLGGLAGLFATTGFEYVPVPAGETKNPQRSMPIALLGSLFGATLLYAVVQVVVTGTHPDLLHADAGAAKPLAEAAAAFSGPALARLISIGAVISSFGFCTGSALVGPRYVAAFAEDSAMPAVLGRRHPVHQTPGLAIAAVSIVAALCAMLLDFDRLADISIAALFLQYIATCLAVLVLRRRRPDAPRAFRLPLGPTIPVLATLGCLLFLRGAARADVLLAAWILLAGLVFRATRLLASRGAEL